LGKHPTSSVAIPVSKKVVIEGRLPAEPVSHVSKDDRTDRARNEPDGKCRKRQQRAGHRIKIWKELRVENQRCGQAVDLEVIPLDRCANGCGEGRTCQRAAGLSARRTPLPK
jgi:hypothetical protein